MKNSKLLTLSEKELKETTGGGIIDSVKALQMLPFVIVIESAKSFFSGLNAGTR
ncbi:MULTISPECIES: hypothetical protein [Tenacibaculum]|uniref:hypothetical protein n=1 Tax=Tenacibaculum TaxID=104267 RepID=UPI000A792A02|nr:hypothetical protein [Tenacibaculum mesophilum]BFF37939.1 hypothetical protein BACT7_28010 [Tenacibaculum mesophilum]BFF41344.1 hypothetical protein BACY1_31490 [Tenacibaculum mesophilum]